MTHPAATPVASWLAVAAAALMASLPFLNPIHVVPIPTFYEEVLALALGLAAIGFAALGELRGGLRGGVAVPAIALWLLALAAVMFAQPWWLAMDYPELPQTAGLVLVWAAALACAGAHLAGVGGERAHIVVASAVLLAALVTAAAGWSNPRGPLGQPNLHANYMVLGVACAGYLWTVSAISGVFAAVAAATLGSSLAVASSRASLIELAWLAAFFWWFARRSGSGNAGRALATVLGAAVVMAACSVDLPSASSEPAESLPVRLVHKPYLDRLAHWEVALRAWMSAPWTGVGAGGYAWAHFTTAAPWVSPPAEWVELNAHNALFHLLAETGLAGALVFAAGLCLWVVRAAKALRASVSPGHAWAVALIGVELAHSAVEYPLWHANFLGVTALLFGMSDPRRLAFRSRILALALVAGIVGFGAVLLASTVAGFRGVLRNPAAHDSPAAIESVRRTLLRPYAELGLALPLALTSENLAGKLALNDRVMRFWPIRLLVEQQVVFLAMAGRDDEALVLLEHLLRLHPGSLAQLRGLVAGLAEGELSADSPLRARIGAPAPGRSPG